VPTGEALGNGVLALVLNAGPVAKFVLAVLLVFSIASWGLIVEKAWQFRRVRRQTLAFLKVFREGRRASIIHGAARTMRESPLAQLYSAAYQEVSRLPEGLEPVYDEPDEGLGAERLEAVRAWPWSRRASPRRSSRPPRASAPRSRPSSPTTTTSTA